jgi:competence ComEA-like helix-hairpin-helix protein
MKKGSTFLLLALTIGFVCFVIGLLIGRNLQSQPVNIQLATNPSSVYSQIVPETSTLTQSGLVNINTASEAILDTLPGIGSVLASRIVEYRQEHGPFQKTTDLTLVEGIGSEKLLTILDLITVED